MRELGVALSARARSDPKAFRSSLTSRWRTRVEPAPQENLTRAGSNAASGGGGYAAIRQQQIMSYGAVSQLDLNPIARLRGALTVQRSLCGDPIVRVRTTDRDAPGLIQDCCRLEQEVSKR